MMLSVGTPNSKEWNELIRAHDDANFLQSEQWGKVYDSLGYGARAIGIYEGNKLVAGVRGIIRDAKRGRFFEIAGGPVVDWSSKKLTDRLFVEIARIGRDEGCVFVRIRPQIIDSPKNRRRLTSHRYIRAQMPLQAQDTSILDLKLSENELMTAMRQQTRYEIRRADKLGIEVHMSHTSKDIKTFYELQQETARRQGFISPSIEFLQALRREFGNSLKIYSATKDGTLLAMALVVTYGEEADYLEGASSPEGRNLPGAHAIQWRAMRDLKAEGVKRYNLWGVAPVGKTVHRYAGVSTFKRGFGGNDVSFVPAHDLPLKHVRYIVNWTIETIRKRVRKLG